MNRKNTRPFVLIAALSIVCTVSLPALSQQQTAKTRAGQSASTSQRTQDQPSASPDARTNLSLPIIGKGTTNFIPVFTGNYTVGNSIVSQSGATLTVGGSVSARTFSGDGSALTNVNANVLDGLSASAFAQQGSSNTFSGDQTITGNLNVTGLLNSMLSIQGNLTDANGEESGNSINGFSGNAAFPGNSIAAGVIGGTIGGGGGSYLPSALPQSPASKVSPQSRRIVIRGNAGVDLSQPYRAATRQRSSEAPPLTMTPGPNVIQPNSNWSTIAGGFNNRAYGYFATVSGGQSNMAGASGHNGATVGGGEFNIASGDSSTVSGGNYNIANGSSSFVGGGVSNTASGDLSSGDCCAAAVGGQSNSASGNDSFVGGGYLNTASGVDGVVPGGEGNIAAGRDTLAGGCAAIASFQGSFVWSGIVDGECPPAHDTGEAQFIAVAAGGVYFYTSVNGSSSNGVGANLASGSGSWSSMSDRNSKTNFLSIDSSSLLEKLVAMPLSTWNYKSQTESIRHLGPMAQDFYAAFGVGEDDKHISTVDADGVALAGIQALYKLEQEKDQKIAELTEALKEKSQELAQRIAALEVSAVTKR